MSYMDDVSDSSSSYLRDKEDQLDAYSQENRNSFRGNHNCWFVRVVQWWGCLGFGSDSGFSSDLCEYKSNATTPKEKFSPNGALDEQECAKLTRTKWTASFRKIIRRIKK